MTVEALRRYAIQRTLFQPMSLRAAISRLGFVQADPIRFPARAQDLILRHRVLKYLAGDLERLYPTLDIEEDVLYAYGFLPRTNWRLLHPRDTRDVSKVERGVLELVREHGPMHPNKLQTYVGRDRAINAWGGYSKAGTRVLQALHYRGLLRIARRDNGIRVYAVTSPEAQTLSPTERTRRLINLVVQNFAPVPDVSLCRILRGVARSVAGLRLDRGAIAGLVAEGEIETVNAGGVEYVRPAGRIIAKDPPVKVRFLAPFDPLVWDRTRFEHFWGSQYRFEAYTPPPKRKLGYYAMPMLWEDSVVGWANGYLNDAQIDVEVGFAKKRPISRAFGRELEAEVERLRKFLSAERATLSLLK